MIWIANDVDKQGSFSMKNIYSRVEDEPSKIVTVAADDQQCFYCLLSIEQLIWVSIKLTYEPVLSIPSFSSISRLLRVLLNTFLNPIRFWINCMKIEQFEILPIPAVHIIFKVYLCTSFHCRWHSFSEVKWILAQNIQWHLLISSNDIWCVDVYLMDDISFRFNGICWHRADSGSHRLCGHWVTIWTRMEEKKISRVSNHLGKID